MIDSLYVELVLFCTQIMWIKPHLEHSEQGLREVVKRAPFGHSLVKVKLAPKKLHAQQGEDNDEEEEQQQQGGDGLHGVEQRGHQVTKRRPMTGEENN